MNVCRRRLRSRRTGTTIEGSCLREKGRVLCRVRHPRGSVPTVRFEFASGGQQFDWANKLTFQLTEDEIVKRAPSC